jgi:hypothetical protein
LTDISVFRQAQQSLHRGGMKGWWQTVHLEPDQWQAIDAAIEDPHITDRAIQIVLKDWGVEVNVNQVSHYRRRKNG